MNEDELKDARTAHGHRGVRKISGKPDESVDSAYDERIKWCLLTGNVQRLGFDKDVDPTSGEKYCCTPRGGTPIEIGPHDPNTPVSDCPMFKMLCKDSTTSDQLPAPIRARRQSQLDILDEAVRRDDRRLRDLRRLKLARHL